MMKVMVDAIKSLKVGKYLVKSFISITLTCFRSLASVRMAEEGTNDILYLPPCDPTPATKAPYISYVFGINLHPFFYRDLAKILHLVSTSSSNSLPILS